MYTLLPEAMSIYSIAIVNNVQCHVMTFITRILYCHNACVYNTVISSLALLNYLSYKVYNPLFLHVTLKQVLSAYSQKNRNTGDK